MKYDANTLLRMSAYLSDLPNSPEDLTGYYIEHDGIFYKVGSFSLGGDNQRIEILEVRNEVLGLVPRIVTVRTGR